MLVCARAGGLPFPHAGQVMPQGFSPREAVDCRVLRVAPHSYLLLVTSQDIISKCTWKVRFLIKFKKYEAIILSISVFLWSSHYACVCIQDGIPQFVRHAHFYFSFPFFLFLTLMITFYASSNSLFLLPAYVWY